MNHIIFLLAYFVVAMGQEDCKNCKDFALKLVAFLVKPDMIKLESDLFKKTICNGDALCGKQVDEYWPKMAPVLLNFPETPNDICSGSPVLCGLTVTDCNSCKQGILEVSKLFQTPAFQKRVELLLAGALYCNTVPDSGHVLPSSRNMQAKQSHW